MTSLKLGLTLPDPSASANQVVALNDNYDIIDSKSPSKKVSYFWGTDDPTLNYEFDDPAGSGIGYARTSINTGGLWREMDTATVGPIVLVGVGVGDWAEVNISGLFNNSPSSALFGLATSYLSAGNYLLINYLGGPCPLDSSSGNGVSSVRAEPNLYSPIRIKLIKEIVVGDLVDSSGALNPVGDRIQISLVVKTVGGYKFIFTSTDIPLILSAKNLGK